METLIRCLVILLKHIAIGRIARRIAKGKQQQRGKPS